MTSLQPPGERLLDVVATMDRLRSPGGCPWDAEQTHESLAKYLLEEAYEAYAAIEDGDLDALRDELGDVLLQVVFHARVAAERDDGWDIDDVAAGLVEKLVRRHPHVFGDVSVSGAHEVVENWARIKESEKGAASVTHVPLAQPALSLATALQKRAEQAGVPPSLVPGESAASETPGQAVAAVAGRLDAGSDDPERAIGELLFAAVALARHVGVDPEAALRAVAREFRARAAEYERDIAEQRPEPWDAP